MWVMSMFSSMLLTTLTTTIAAKQHATLKPRDYSDTAVCFQSILTKYYAKYFFNGFSIQDP